LAVASWSIWLVRQRHLPDVVKKTLGENPRLIASRLGEHCNEA